MKKFTDALYARSQQVFQFIDAVTHRVAPVPYQPAGRLQHIDGMLAIVMGMIAVGIAVWSGQHFDPRIYQFSASDVWYQADQPRVLEAMTLRLSDMHYRDSVHPLFSLLGYPPTKLQMLFGVPPVKAAYVVMRLNAFISGAAMLLAMRGLGMPRLWAVGLVLVFLLSSTFLSWYSIIEIYAFAGTTIAVMLAVLTCVNTNHVRIWVAATAGTLMCTITNWTLGLAALLFSFDAKRALRLAIIGLLIVGIAAVVQREIFPRAGIFFRLDKVANEEVMYTTIAGNGETEGWSPTEALWSVLVSTAVSGPARAISANDSASKEKVILSNQDIAFGARTWPNLAAVGAWLLMLAIGLHGGITDLARRRVFGTLILFIAGQVILHLLYGSETFLYAGDYAAALILVASFGWFSRFRHVAMAATCVFICAGGFANIAQFEAAAAAANDIAVSAAALP